MKNVQGTFFGTSKQVIVYLIPTVDEYPFLVGLDEEQKVTPKQSPSKWVAKKVVEEVVKDSEKTASSSEFEDLFNVSNCQRVKKAKWDAQVLAITNVLTLVMEMIDCVESKWIEWRRPACQVG